MTPSLPADWIIGEDGLVHSPGRAPMTIAEAVILRDLLVTSSKPHNRRADS